ncbi:TPA: tail fiber assembly protein [Yersinia enterocolitica]|uniref:tail fiber assembly protein n=1 Tax=Yersinia bercovieri TaxID=634 RepID=UPI0011A208A2|nr:tail fiber assembly protein [Yersinia bercovieri]HDZ9654966.1 tail fiber assembly protein [Yersinia enterocolitica]HEN3559204.1 tail fiber assembly protein [Yersinia enterocolitica]
MKALFSHELMSFIPENMAVDGSYSQDITDNLIAATNEELAMYWRQTPPDGKTLGATNGRPVWVDLPPPTPEQLAEIKAINVAQAKVDKSKLISDASDKVEILKDRIEAGQDKAAELKLWKAYRIALDDVDINNPVWPTAPE